MFAAEIINAEAGDHPVPSDPRVLEASLRAADLCWHRFPYLAERYGERGHRFTRSDSAWLATLTCLNLAKINEQVSWLRGVLATRGVPSIMLQAHLETLCDELDAAVPAEHLIHAKLRQVAERLHEARRVHISDCEAERLSDAFDHAVGVGLASRLPRTALLLVSSVADENDGARGATASLGGWLTDAQRFPPAWRAAVEASLLEARTCGSRC